MPEWALLHSVVMAQAMTRMGMICGTPLRTLDEALEQEYKKGEASGLQLAVSLPKTIIESCDYEIAQLKELTNVSE